MTEFDDYVYEVRSFQSDYDQPIRFYGVHGSNLHWISLQMVILA